MKPIKTKTFLVQNCLIVFSVMLAILALILSAKSISFFPSIEAVTVDSETNIQIARGMMPLSHILLYLSFIFVYLVFEFYGFKSAFYTTINISIAMALSYGAFLLLNRYILDPDKSHTDQLLSQLLIFRPRAAIALVTAVAAGFSITLILAATIKKITSNYFMFIRFPIASIVGFTAFTGIIIYINNINLLAPESMLLEALPPLSHFLTLIIVSVIPLYILRLILGIFRGRAREDEFEDVSGKTLFKGSSNREIPHSPQTQIPPKQDILPAPEEEEPKEDTVSKKNCL